MALRSSGAQLWAAGSPPRARALELPSHSTGHGAPLGTGIPGHEHPWAWESLGTSIPGQRASLGMGIPGPSAPWRPGLWNWQTTPSWSEGRASGPHHPRPSRHVPQGVCVPASPGGESPRRRGPREPPWTCFRRGRREPAPTRPGTRPGTAGTSPAASRTVCPGVAPASLPHPTPLHMSVCVTPAGSPCPGDSQLPRDEAPPAPAAPAPAAASAQPSAQPGCRPALPSPSSRRAFPSGGAQRSPAASFTTRRMCRETEWKPSFLGMLAKGGGRLPWPPAGSSRRILSPPASLWAMPCSGPVPSFWHLPCSP